MPYGKLKPEGYISRIVDSKLERLLGLFGAVEVAGTMWCGKTWTSLARAESVTRIGLSGPRSAAEADPSTALIGVRPHLVDEWQDVPAIWDEVRAAVDADAASKGSFILTGSAEPNKDKVHHSGAGRIAKLRMSTMTLQETGVSSGAVSLAGLFEGRYVRRRPLGSDLRARGGQLGVGGYGRELGRRADVAGEREGHAPGLPANKALPRDAHAEERLEV